MGLGQGPFAEAAGFGCMAADCRRQRGHGLEEEICQHQT